MPGGGLMGAAPARSGAAGGVADINPLAANILSTLLQPGAGAALANSMAMLQNPGPSGGKKLYLTLANSHQVISISIRRILFDIKLLHPYLIP